MSSLHNSLSTFFWRLLIAAPFFLLAWWVMYSANDFTSGAMAPILGVALSLVGAIIVGGPAARLLSEPWGNFFYPEAHSRKPPPMYSIPESRRMKGNCEEAILGYMEIAEKYPKEVRPYIEVIDISITDMHDQKRAHLFYEKGLAALSRKCDRELLTRMYAHINSRLKDRTPQPKRIIPRRGPAVDGEKTAK